MAKSNQRQETGSFGFGRFAFAVGIMLVMGVIGYIIMVSGAGKDEPDLTKIQVTRDATTVASFQVELMVTEEQRRQGLSGRKHLPEDHGMLFIFPHAANYSMWMFEMNFPLDFIFADDERTIVHLLENEPPCVNAQSCPSIRPGRAVRYILEVPGGTVSGHGIRLGDRLQLPDALPPVL